MSDPDVEKVNQALLVLSGHLPLFSGDKRKEQRAQAHLILRDEALNAMDRIADRLEVERGPRKMTA